RGLAGVRHHVHGVDLRHRGDPVEDPVDDRAAADRQQLLRVRVGERAQPGRVARGEDDRLHTSAPARLRAYGARCTPASVTIAAISPAGVTSNAALRAGKRAVTSAGSRSSIGIDAPSGAARSIVELGATTYSGMSWCRARTASEYVPILFAASPFAA